MTAMRHAIAGCVAILIAGPAAAEDMFAVPPSAPQAAPHSWAGFYGGLNAGGASAGGQAGYNWQFGNAVVGVEGDLGRKGGGALDPGQAGAWQGSVRGRAGIASDRLFLYGTGGAALGPGRP